MAKGNRHLPELSTSGILTQDSRGNARHFFHLGSNPITSPRAFLPAVYPPPTICSSSRGLVVCRDSTSNYYVGNPFIRGPNAYPPLLSLPRPHPADTPVVLATEYLPNPQALVFHVICAVREGPGSHYTFHTYSSDNGVWISSEPINLRYCNLLPNTGVSCGRMAYWVSWTRLMVVRDDVRTNTVSLLAVPVSMSVLWSKSTRLQLGRVEDQIGLVVVVVSEGRPRVELHVLRGVNGWENRCVLNVELREDAYWESMKSSWERGDVIVCREMPRVVRFESFKMEGLLGVNGRLLIWEGNSVDLRRMRQKLTRWNASVCVTDGMAHVRTSLLPPR